MSEDLRGEMLRSGIPVSAGIAIGRAYLVGRDTLKAPRHHVAADEVEAELERLDRAITASDRQLAKVKAKLASEDETDYHIIEAHQLMLHDEHLVVAAKGYIQAELICAEWGLRKAVDDILVVFQSIEDEYLSERKTDVEFVFERILRNLLGREDLAFAPPPDAVVVAYDLSPMDAAQLHKAAVAGLITDAGGKTSHTAIIARAHELPAVVGLEDITEVVEEDDLLIVDGASGVVVVNPTAATVGRYRDAQRRQVAAGLALRGQRDLPAVTLDGVTVNLLANLDGPDEAAAAVEYGAIGVGLVRTEFLYMVSDELPDEQTHYQAAVDILGKLGGRPVTIRTFDLGADKLAGFLEEAALDEANPALGLRSIRLCLNDLGRGLFRAQLRGLLRAAVHGPLRLMFPMISGVAELRAVRAVLDDVRAELTAEGAIFRADVPIGIMIEMPSSALIADILAREVDFFSIGTNDLIQYTMAVDRVNEYVSYLYEPLHPALLRLLGTVGAAARAAGIPASVCGELAGDPMLAPVLVGLGLCDLSMSAVSIPEVKAAVRGFSAADARALVERILMLPTADEVRAAVEEFAATRGLPGRPT
ncbi:MAG: phosphoenolpyruvate--protein phosphotransferase [Kofleriaceae bacterium]|jgi:phosphotransferase system enzyme I (PtsI)|nr:phosphoenolpyruvate--protein phosphotransferase [Kofleriaceae bacterium]MBP6838431.1 phosphoenolpyruvate--protein phosphotransferase [Kofleriaceae bacterium]MBP9204716.1 phosphoenolpyruvate--protein phosphotransferase [Kofleriaceae bacterium]